MAKVFIEETTLTAIGDAIRGKTGKTELIDPANMSTEIASIEAGGGGGYEIPDEAFMITGDCSYLAQGDVWYWFFDLYKNKIQTQDITNMSNMFRQDSMTTLTWRSLGGFPFTFNIKNVTYFSNAFAQLGLQECPKIRGTINWGGNTTLSNMMGGNYMTSVDDLFTPEMMEGYSSFKVTSTYSCPQVGGFFSSMTYVTHIPEWWYKFKVNPESTAMPNTSYLPLYNAFNYSSKLSEALNLPVLVLNSGVGLTKDQFYNTFQNTYELAHITFETNEDGSPIVAQWNAQTIDLSKCVGWNGPKYKTVADSIYNHDSAVETINSLPDTSAYLASAGGTNTIKFKKTAGSATDGGAIENLTEAEIAVAAAKGWTVTLVN